MSSNKLGRLRKMEHLRTYYPISCYLGVCVGEWRNEFVKGAVEHFRKKKKERNEIIDQFCSFFPRGQIERKCQPEQTFSDAGNRNNNAQSCKDTSTISQYTLSLRVAVLIFRRYSNSVYTETENETLMEDGSLAPVLSQPLNYLRL